MIRREFKYREHVKMCFAFSTQDFLYLLSSELGKRGYQIKLKRVEFAASSINNKQFPETR